MPSSRRVLCCVAGVLWSGCALAQDLPRFSIEATCRTAQPLNPGAPSPYDSCVREEGAAEQQLRSIWSQANAAHKETCIQETQIGGPPSYVDVLSCIQMYQGGGRWGGRPRKSP